MPSSARIVRRSGLAIVLVGLLAGGGVYVRASDPDSDVDELAHQREMAQVARIGGTATAQTVRFDQWLASMWQGQQLGVTLALLGLVVGGLCWYVGGLMAEEVVD